MPGPAQVYAGQKYIIKYSHKLVMHMASCHLQRSPVYFYFFKTFHLKPDISKRQQWPLHKLYDLVHTSAVQTTQELASVAERHTIHNNLILVDTENPHSV